MEWQGINLTNYHQTNWSKKGVSLILQYICLIIITLVTAIIIQFYTNNINNIKKNYDVQNNKIHQNINNKKNRLDIFILKQKIKQHIISSGNIKNILSELRNLPSNGSIIEVNINHKNRDYFELWGKVKNQEEFDRLSDYLHHLKPYKTSIDMFQTNTNNELEFMIKVIKK